MKRPELSDLRENYVRYKVRKKKMLNDCNIIFLLLKIYFSLLNEFNSICKANYSIRVISKALPL